jgi:DNA repair protein SbcD/Mre11
MQILHTSDWHVGRTIRGRSRHDEHRAVLGEMVDIVEDRQIDLVVVAGDQFDTTVPSAQAERLVWRTLLAFADRGAKVVVVAGNHDNAAKLDALAPLLMRAGDITVAAHVRPPHEGGRVRIETRDGETDVALVPFLSQRGIVKTADLLDRDAAQHAQAYAQRVGVILEALTDTFGSGETVDLVVGHLTVVGTGSINDQLGGGERLSQIFDYVVPPQAFPTSAHYVALGHLHQPHEVPGPAPLRYSGSPLHLDFGEVVSQRGVSIVDAEPDTPARITHHPLNAGFPLITLRGDLVALEQAVGDLDDEVYVRVIVEEAPRAGLAEDVRELIPQAVDVRIAETIDETEADPLEADEALRLEPSQLFSQYLEAQGVDDDRLLALFRELLDDLHTAHSAEDEATVVASTEGEG